MAAFQRYAKRAATETGLPASRLGDPLQARLVAPDGTPLPGVRVTLRRKGKAEPFFDGYSGVGGRVTVFPRMHGASSAGIFELRAFRGDQQGAISAMLTTKDAPVQVTMPATLPARPDFLDLMFVVDTTGSMGDELAWLTKEMRGIVRQARRQAGDIDVNYGLVVYRDKGDVYEVRNFGMDLSAGQIQRALRQQNAMGGGDYPEAAAKALATGVGQNWRRGQGKRILFHIADAPPHSRDASRYVDAAAMAAGKNVQIFGLGASGVAAESEFLMRQAALATNGRYIFLTDDSGVGHAHAEPSISCYRVTALKDLMRRVLVSELTGIRQEAPSSAVIREVGTYQNGVCKN
ncbi:Protein containing VWFA domain [Candidatus Rhodobacter oscarellae]|uniref:Protein containing VWFA domain n=2 Tax=Candidatus Rhodobacter oscarellae TaxID=1675527 RepID=A0A0J9H0A4_9RHOB|nr:Protein containing VWFA domain [Candidatus Rhodobacter lobularis]